MAAVSPHAAWSRQERVEDELTVVVEVGVGPDGEVAAPAELGQEAPARGRRSRGRSTTRSWRAGRACGRRHDGTRPPTRPGRPAAPSARPTAPRRPDRRDRGARVPPAAITMAPPSGTFVRRVSMLPRRSSKTRSGRSSASWARRRTAPVATRAPRAQAGERGADEGVAGVGPWRHRRRAPGRRATAPTGGPWPSARRDRPGRRAPPAAPP